MWFKLLFFFVEVELTPARLTDQPAAWTEEVAARLESAPFSLLQPRSQSLGAAYVFGLFFLLLPMQLQVEAHLFTSDGVKAAVREMH